MSHAPHSVVLAVAVLVLAGCASTSRRRKQRRRRRCRSRRRSRRKRRRRSARTITTELAAGYLRARPDRRSRSRSSTKRSKLDPNYRADLQRLRPRLHDAAARTRRREQQFPARARARAERLRDPPELGLVPVHARRARANRFPSSRPRSRNPLYRTPEIALINAGKCTRRRSATTRSAEEYFRRALSASPDNATAAVQPRAARVPRGATRRRARAGCGRVMQQARAARPKRSISACASSASSATARPRLSYASQLRNRYPGVRGGQGDRRGACE